MPTYKKISEFDTSGPVSGTDIVPIVQSGVTKKAAASAIANTATAIGDHTSGTITPPTNDSESLGTALLRWSDAFLAAGGVLNFDGIGAITGGLVFTHDARSGAGAISLTTVLTQLITTGANALTLADGAEGQIKIIVMTTDGGDGTLTPTNLVGASSTITFNDVGDSVILIFLGGQWNIVANNGCTVA